MIVRALELVARDQDMVKERDDEADVDVDDAGCMGLHPPRTRNNASDRSPIPDSLRILIPHRYRVVAGI